MSSIKLKHSGGNGVSITAPDTNPSSDRTIKLPSTDVDGVITTKDSNNSLQAVTGLNGSSFGNRNLIINGAMQVAQRGTSSTTSNDYAVDRFKHNFNGTDEAPTFAQVDVSSSDLPFTKGFTKALKVTNGNQTGGAGAADRIRIEQKIEAQNMRNSGWNYTSSSSYITLSFYVKSSVSQTFYGRLATEDGTGQSYIFETGTLSANTWTKITKTVPGNSNLQFDNDSGTGLVFNITLFGGTDQTGSVTLNQWAAFNASVRSPDFTSTWYTTNDATFEMTGVQLEVGSVATDFEHRLIGQELALCQRYYWIVDGQGRRYCGQWNSNRSTAQYSHPVEMRATPTSSGTITNASRIAISEANCRTHSTFYVNASQSAFVEYAEFDAEL